MPTFEQLENQFNGAQVSAVHQGQGISGYMTLEDANTKLVLSSSNRLDFKTDQNGWFDLAGLNVGGTTTLMQRAVVTAHHFERISREGRNEWKVFPNLLAFGSDALSSDAKVRKISFRSPYLRPFFHYEAVESQFLYKPTEQTLGALRALREAKMKLVGAVPAEDKYIFRPEHLLIVHRIPRAFKFRVEDRHYEICLGLSIEGATGGARASVDTTPIASISFDRLVDIDDALTHAFEWRRCFSQLTMTRIPLEQVTVTAKWSSSHSPASLYLPYLGEEFKMLAQKRQTHPGDIPWNQWNERRSLAAAMRGWLSKAHARRQFRFAVDQVIGHRAERSALDDILRLCAGIESLDELAGTSEISDSHISTLVNAAESAASSSSIPVTRERLQGLFSMLQKPGMSGRLKLLGERLQGHINVADWTLLTRDIRRLRNKVAHGEQLAAMESPVPDLAADGLAAACSLYDLVSCGFPTVTRSRDGLLSLQRFRSAIQAIKSLSEG